MLLYSYRTSEFYKLFCICFSFHFSLKPNKQIYSSTSICLTLKHQGTAKGILIVTSYATVSLNMLYSKARVNIIKFMQQQITLRISLLTPALNQYCLLGCQ